MNEYVLRDKYFEWLKTIILPFKPARKSYNKLLTHLHNRDFTYILPMDANRYEDGVNLRYRYGYESGISNSEIASSLDIFPCSILEMLVALAFRSEESIMFDPEFGDRTGKWFWGMIENLGLIEMSDSNYHRNVVDDILDRFLNREYEKDGRGSVARIPAYPGDMRDVDIWYQFMWHLSNRYG